MRLEFQQIKFFVNYYPDFPLTTIMQTSASSTILSVTELNQTIALLLERSIPLCWIGGEVSNFTRAVSGHWYFTLKDPQAQVRVVMFKSRTIGADFIPREGEKIEVRATATLYAPRGEYQLNVEAIRRAGLGNLYEAFLKLKQKLSDAGLFNSERKKNLPPFPMCVGIVTSPQAAALRDILITLKRRAPHIKIIFYPTPVQGNGSAAKIIQAIQQANVRNECDVLLIARGGGSIEDLWSFNDEQVAHAIAHCTIPTITGIGHETDFTIADFVADLRAPTPTAAAEMALVARADLLQHMKVSAEQLTRLLRRRLDQHYQTLDSLSHRLISPSSAIQNQRLKLSGMQIKIKHAWITSTQQINLRLEQLKHRLHQQVPNIAQKKTQLGLMNQQLHQQVHQHLALQKQRLYHLTTQLELLNPQRTLERGYAIVMNQHGKILRKPTQFTAPSNISVKLAEGEVDLGIIQVQSHL